MKVIQACTGFPPDRQGGAENVVSSILSGLPKNKYDTTVLTRFWSRNISSKHVRQLRTLPGEALGYLSWSVGASSIVLKARPDILHCHGLEGAALCSAAKAGPRARIMHVHNSLSREGLFFKSLYHRLGHGLLSRACEAADLVVCPTSAVRDDLIANLASIAPRKIVVVPNPVDATRKHSEVELDTIRRRYGLQDKKVILYFGKIKWTKGIEYMCRAYLELRDTDKVKLVVAGAPTDDFLAYLKKTYPEVVFTGYVDDPTVFYQIADLFCIYTTGFDGGETFAVALAQAMQQRVPVVCSDNPIFREVTRGAAIFAAPNDSHALSEAFASALANPEGARTMAERAFNVAELEYGSEAFAARLGSLYSRLV